MREGSRSDGGGRGTGGGPPSPPRAPKTRPGNGELDLTDFLYVNTVPQVGMDHPGFFIRKPAGRSQNYRRFLKKVGISRSSLLTEGRDAGVLVSRSGAARGETECREPRNMG